MRKIARKWERRFGGWPSRTEGNRQSANRQSANRQHVALSRDCRGPVETRCLHYDSNVKSCRRPRIWFDNSSIWPALALNRSPKTMRRACCASSVSVFVACAWPRSRRCFGFPRVPRWRRRRPMPRFRQACSQAGAISVQPAAGAAVPPGRPGVALPSSRRPRAPTRFLLIRDIRIDGATVYSPEQLQPLYADLIGHEIHPPGRLRPRAAHHREIWRRRLCALPRHRAAAEPRAARRGGSHPGDRRLCRQGGVAGLSIASRDYFSYYAAKIVADRPANVRTIERYLLLAGDLPGLKFSSSLKASEKNPNAATLSSRSSTSRSMPWRTWTIAARRSAGRSNTSAPPP